MVKNFEDITSDLSETELELIPFVIKGFMKHDETNPIKAPVIVKKMNEFFASKQSPFKMTEVKLRKCVNHIRSKSLLALIATSDGYFITGDVKVIESQILSLEQRANAILNCAIGMKKFVHPPINNNNNYCKCASHESYYTFGDVKFCNNCNKPFAS